MFIHPQILQELADGRIEDLRREAARSARPTRTPRLQDDLSAIALRLCRVGDDDALTYLAALEERSVPQGQFVWTAASWRHCRSTAASPCATRSFERRT